MPNEIKVQFCDNDTKYIAVRTTNEDVTFVRMPSWYEKLLGMTWEKKVQKVILQIKERERIIEKHREAKNATDKK
jgi:hypothetical protein